MQLPVLFQFAGNECLFKFSRFCVLMCFCVYVYVDFHACECMCFSKVFGQKFFLCVFLTFIGILFEGLNLIGSGVFFRTSPFSSIYVYVCLYERVFVCAKRPEKINYGLFTHVFRETDS